MHEWYKKLLFLCAGKLIAIVANCHPMPHSTMLLDVDRKNISATLQIPLNEFQFAFPDENIDSGYQTLLQRKNAWLNAYLLQHLNIKDSSGRKWTISILNKSVSENEQPLSGKYHELCVRLLLQPPAGSSPRSFVMQYDVLLHQLVTHKVFLKINSDWYGGLTGATELGVLAVNPGDNKVQPVVIKLENGSIWKGFVTMTKLGIGHILEGTDHLLFVFMLVLPASLITKNRKWYKYGGIKFSLIRLTKLVTAFTIGHSISLILASLKIFELPGRPVEIAIGVTILVTAIHAIRPLFPGKEALIALSFGLIHGFAFAGILAEMNLSGSTLAWSILGFNTGIELIQLFLLICIVPWLIMLSNTPWYSGLRITAASLGIIAALGWIVERISLKQNFVSMQVENIAAYGKYFIIAVVLIAILSALSANLQRQHAKQ